METRLRKTGISAVGDLPWGTHLCHFYETKQDLLDTLIPYFKAGLENNEFCLWVFSEPLTAEEARQALGQAVPDLDRYLAERRIEIIPHHEWYLRGETFDLHTVIAGCKAKLAEALAIGYAGLRFTGDASWIQKEDWEDFRAYEKELGGLIARQRMIIFCTYSLAKSTATDILNVASIHQVAVAMRNGHQEMVETPELKQAKAEIKWLNDELEQRVVERTRELAATNEELRREIVERERAEEALRRNEAYLAEGQKISHTGRGAWNVATGEVFWSQETYRIYGFEPGSVKPSYDLFFQIVHPDDQPFVAQTFEKVVRENSGYELDFRIVRPDGRVRYIHSLGHPVFNEAGDLDEVVGSVLDVTERKHADEALRASNDELQLLNEKLQVTNNELEETTEELESSRDELQAVNMELKAKVVEVSLANSDLRNLMESTDIGTIFLDRELCIKRYTPQIEKLFNVLPSDLNRPLAHLTHRLDHLNLQEDARQVLADLQTVEREVHSRDDHCYIMRLLPYRTEEDKIDGVVVTFVEITERKRAEKNLQMAQTELAHVTRVTTLGEMTASIAHEVNQPLAAIVTNGDACLRLLTRPEPDIDGVGEAVEAMISDSLRASEVIKRIRTLLRKAAPEKTRLDINGMIQEVIALTANELSRNQVMLRRELEAGLQPALADRVQLQQVMLNLILNGNEAMSQAGWQPRELLISSQKYKLNDVMVAVRDSGMGLKPQDAERIFDPFFTTKESGLGLGLSISRTIIEAHGGRLWATANEGQGTTLHFTLPTHSEIIT